MKVNINSSPRRWTSLGTAGSVALVTIASVVSGCGGTKSTQDAAVDAAIGLPDPRVLCAAELDAGTSDASVDPDAGSDAGVDVDASTDAAVEVDASTDAGTTGNERLDVAVSIATNVVLPTLREQEAALRSLVCATLAFSDAPSDSAASAAAQDAWRRAIAVVERAELLRFGPAGAPATTVDGQDLGDQIYAWTLLNRCKIDQTIVDGSYADPVVLAASSINGRGLGAVEYLLFPPGATNGCASTHPINAGGTWSAVTDLAARRAKYASNAALVAYAAAARLRTAWEPSGGNFLGAVANAGSSTSPYANVQAVLNAISDGLFYIYSNTKDMKVETPAGITSMPTETPVPRPESVESPFAHASLAEIRANLVGFRAVFTGGASLGFDDLLASLGQSTLSDQMLAAVDNAIAAVDAVPVPLEEAVITNTSEVQALASALHAITDLLKTQFVGILDLTLPMSVAGDND